jgi:hypothetical protein
MKIKRLTFTKKVVRLACYAFPLLFVYHMTPQTIEFEGKIVFIACIIIFWELGGLFCKLFEV